MPLEVGSRLGHYDVTALIGEGGMGQVYQATDTGSIPQPHPLLTVDLPVIVFHGVVAA